MKRAAQNLLLVVASVLLSVGIAEVALRLAVGPREPAGEASEMLARSKAVMPDPGVANVSLRGLVQPSANDRIVYEMKPGLRATFIGVPVAINAAGFRERELPRDKPPGTFRIVGIGDSVMFGWGVPVEATYLRVLERLLEARGGGLRYETLNFAVPGYNAVMEVETLRAVARGYAPDLIVVGYVGNDDQLPNFLKRSALRFPETLYTYNLLVHGIQAMRVRSRALLAAGTDSPDGRMSFRGEVPEQYRDMEGPDAVRRAYAELEAMSREMAVPVVVLGDYRGKLDAAQVAQLEARGRFIFVEVTDVQAAYGRRRGAAVTGAETTIAPRDPHPNVLGHRIYAEGLYDVLTTRGLLAARRSPGS